MPHAHSHAQVLLGVEGGLALEVNGRSAWVDATAGLVIPAGATHGFESRAGARVWVVDAPACLSLDRLRAFALPPGWAANPGCDSSPGQSTATDAGTGTASRADGQTGTGLSATQVLDTLGQAAPRAGAPPGGSGPPTQAAVADTLHQPWPVQRMAALYCLSVPRFQVRWQALTDLLTQAWLRGQRLDAAQRQRSRLAAGNGGTASGLPQRQRPAVCTAPRPGTDHPAFARRLTAGYTRQAISIAAVPAQFNRFSTAGHQRHGNMAA